MVTVTAKPETPKKVEGITVTPETMTLIAGAEPKTITATITPSDAANKEVTWTSSNTAVATVANGVVTPISAGTATITATSVADPTKKATALVEVKTKPETPKTITVGLLGNRSIQTDSSLDVSVVSSPSDAVKRAMSSSTDVASVSVSGDIVSVTGVNAGEAIITVTCEKDGYTSASTFFIIYVYKSDARKLSEDKAALTIPLGDNSSSDDIKTSLGELPLLLANGTTVKWTSSDPDVISNDGKTVVRPAIDAADKTITMTASLTNGDLKDEVPFVLKVKHQLTKMKTLTYIKISSQGYAEWSILTPNYGYDILLYKGNDCTYVTTIQVPQMSEQKYTFYITKYLLEYGPDLYSIAIRVKGNGTTTEDGDLSKKSTIVRQLPNVTGMYWDGSIAKWGKVDYANGYFVRLYEDGVEIKSIVVNNSAVTEMDFTEYIKKPDSKYTFTVKSAAGSDVNKVHSEAVESEVRLFPTSDVVLEVKEPSADIKFQDGSRNGSVVLENDTQAFVLKATKAAAQEIDLTGLDFSIQSQTDTEINYSINTKDIAKGSCKKLRIVVKEEGKSYLVYNLAVSVKPTAPTLSVQGIARWEDVENENGYKVALYLNDKLVIEKKCLNNVTEADFYNNFFTDPNAAKGGKYTVKVTSLGDGVTYFDSAQSDASNSVVQYAAVQSGYWEIGSDGENKAVWSDYNPDLGETPPIKYIVYLYKDNNIFATRESTTNSCDFSFGSGEEGIYTFSVKIINNETTIDSMCSEKLDALVHNGVKPYRPQVTSAYRISKNKILLKFDSELYNTDELRISSSLRDFRVHNMSTNEFRVVSVETTEYREEIIITVENDLPSVTDPLFVQFFEDKFLRGKNGTVESFEIDINKGVALIVN